MNYEQKYTEALEKIRDGLHPLPDGTKISGVTRAFLEEVFPELKESEDEKIRKAVIEMIHDTPSIECEENYNVCKNDILAWLEKQGEKKPTEWSEDDEKMLHTIIADFKGLKHDNTSTLESHFNECMDWLKSLKERIGE